MKEVRCRHGKNASLLRPAANRPTSQDSGRGPVYPVALRGTGTGGTVVMEGRIGLDGYIGDIRIIGDAHPELAHSAIAAVRDWRFTQTLLNCQPVEVTMTITTNFNAVPPPPPPAPRP